MALRELVGLSDTQLLALNAKLLDEIGQKLGILVDRTLATPDTSLIVVYPVQGGLRAVPAGTTTIDLLRGQVTRPDGAENTSVPLDSYVLPYVSSATLFFDTDVDVELRVGGKTSGRLSVDQCAYFPILSLPMDEMVINSDYPYNMKARFSHLATPPVNPRPATAFQERYSDGTTTNSWVAAGFAPTKGGVLADAYRVNNIYVGSMGIKVFIVTNNGANSLDLNVQNLIYESGTWIDNPATGVSVTLGSGNSALVETGVPCQYIRLRVKSTTANLPTTFAIQYWAFTSTR